MKERWKIRPENPGSVAGALKVCDAGPTTGCEGQTDDLSERALCEAKCSGDEGLLCFRLSGDPAAFVPFTFLLLPSMHDHFRPLWGPGAWVRPTHLRGQG